jgi:hypothetical protein
MGGCEGVGNLSERLRGFDKKDLGAELPRS